jgi:hypothetical protein
MSSVNKPIKGADTMPLCFDKCMGTVAVSSYVCGSLSIFTATTGNCVCSELKALTKQVSWLKQRS